MIEFIDNHNNIEEIDIQEDLESNLVKNLNECAICLDFSDNLIKYEHCMPVYVHAECLDEWYRNRYNHCVICNKKIVKDGQSAINKIGETRLNTQSTQCTKYVIFALISVCVAALCSATAVIIYQGVV